MTNKELMIKALERLVKEAQEGGVSWSAINQAQGALMAVRKPRSPYLSRAKRAELEAAGKLTKQT